MSCATSIRTSWCRQGETPAELPAQADRSGRAPALAAGRAGDDAREPSSTSWRSSPSCSYEPYFLTVHDIVAFARAQDILCQGRGSAANSRRLLLPRRHQPVDPERGAALLFERFISRERNEPPDIDIDFEHERREEVIQYIYAKYGRERAALAATVIMYRPRSALRDLARSSAWMPPSSARLAKVMQWWDGSDTLAERRARGRLRPDRPGAAAHC